ncbi:DUF4296 domain-containing protein [Jiulongibacter sediminis]|uniref:DUF4296 domain-containing protein n=1 Tax=Jiulongibacter sediminis TaxID=1605367 RepID=UPI0006DC627C|nr:DUF4296 domain-containing protein [Jiulongibacter sediminis]
MKFKTYYFLITLLFASCGKPDAPDNLIDESTMVNILTELQLAESEVGRLSLQSYDSAVVAFQFSKAETLKKYGVDSLAYITSYNYYGEHPREFSFIFQDVEARLKELEDQQKGGRIERKENERPTYE